MSGFLAAGLFTSSIAFLICASMSSSWAKPGVIVNSARAAEKSRRFSMISEARETLGKEKHDLAIGALQRTYSRSARTFRNRRVETAQKAAKLPGDDDLFRT